MTNSFPEAGWPPRHDFPVLPRNEIHVWRLSSPGAVDAKTELPGLSLLTDEEQKRLAAMKSPQAHYEFCSGRSTLRKLLGHYLDMPPREVPLAYGERGKPELACSSDLQFNVTNNPGLILLAIGRAGAVGVDVESLDRKVDLKGIARRYYAPAEIQQLEQSGWSRRQFFHTWTCKEACLKAAGHGISIELSGIDTANLPGRVTIPLETGEQEWCVRSLPEIPGYAAALACTSSIVQVKTWQWALADTDGRF